MSVTVKIGGSIAGLKAALTQAETRVQSFGKKVKSFFGGVGGMLAGAGLGLGFKKIVDDLDNMSKRSRALGVTVEEMQKLEYVANSTNMGFDQLSSGMAKSMQVVSQALGGDEKAVQKLQRLNVEISKLNGANAYQIMELIAAGAAKIEDPVERVTALMDVLGAKIGKNAQFFTDFFDRVKAIEQAGGIISNEDAAAAEQINQSLTEAAKAIRAILVDTGALAKLAEILDNYAALINEGKLRNRTGVKQTWQSRAWDIAESAELWFMPWRYFTGSDVRGMRDALGSASENYAAAAALTPSTSAKRPYVGGIEEEDDSEYIAAMEEMSAAVDNLAAAVDPQKNPRSVMGRGGADTALTDSLRRIGGNLGFNYGRAAENYAKTTAEAAEKTVAVLESMNNSGISLRA